MRLAADFDRIGSSGAEVIAVSVDDDVRQAGMAQRWGLNLIRFVSDPGGDRFLRPFGLYNPDDRGGIALGGIVVVTPDGEEAYRFENRDFADRTGDKSLWAFLDGLGLDPVDPPPWEPGIEVPDDLDGYFPTSSLVPYFKGNFFGAIALGRRVADPEALATIKEHQAMAQATFDAYEQRRAGT